MAITITLEEYRALAADARAAMRTIREVVEQNAPPGSVPAEEHVEPPKEAEVLVKGVLGDRRGAEAAARRARSARELTLPAPTIG